MILRIYLRGYAWAVSFVGLDSGASGVLDRAVVDGWEHPCDLAARWIVAAWHGAEQARARGLAVREIQCVGIPAPLVTLIQRRQWPPEIRAYLAELEGGARLTGCALSRRERSRIGAVLETAPATDAVLTGVAGLGAVGLTAMVAG